MIRPVRLSDAADIAGIYNHYVTETTVSFETVALSVDSMRRRIESLAESFPYMVWEEDGHVVAYCYAHLWKDRAAYSHTWENTVYLAPDYRGRGIGRLLMERLIAECRNRGAYVLIACITAENTASIRFHEALGFRQVSLFRGVGEKFGRRLDVADLQLDLS